MLVPTPLQSFDALAGPLQPELASLDERVASYRDARAVGRLLPNTLDALRIELTYNSNAIEGNTLSLRETQLVLEGKTPSSEKLLREVFEARNHDRAFRSVSEWASARRLEPILERDLLDLHRIVLDEIDPVSAGSYRTQRVRIAGTGFIPPGGHRFAELIACTFARANRSEPHPVLRAAELHYNLVAIHPFSDGNGRTARLMMNYLLMRHDYPPALVRVARRAEYLAALDESNHGRIDAFGRVIIDAIGQTLDQLLI